MVKSSQILKDGITPIHNHFLSGMEGQRGIRQKSTYFPKLAGIGPTPYRVRLVVTVQVSFS